MQNSYLNAKLLVWTYFIGFDGITSIHVDNIAKYSSIDATLVESHDVLSQSACRFK